MSRGACCTTAPPSRVPGADLGSCRATAPARPGASFTQGVASGEPSPQGITLWTRLEGLDRRARVLIEVSSDPGFSTALLEAEAVASPESDGTVHARIAGPALQPGQQYHYRFATKDADVASLGTAASHGCIRMSIPEVEEVYDKVPVGTPIYIF